MTTDRRSFLATLGAILFAPFIAQRGRWVPVWPPVPPPQPSWVYVTWREKRLWGEEVVVQPIIGNERVRRRDDGELYVESPAGWSFGPVDEVIFKLPSADDYTITYQ